MSPTDINSGSKDAGAPSTLGRHRRARHGDLIGPKAQRGAQDSVKWIYILFVLVMFTALFGIAAIFLAGMLPTLPYKSLFQVNRSLAISLVVGSLLIHGFLVFKLDRLRDGTNRLGQNPTERQYQRWLRAMKWAFVAFCVSSAFGLLVEVVLFFMPRDS